MAKIVNLSKRDNNIPFARLIKGDSNTMQVSFRIRKMYGGVDLSSLSWSVISKNWCGFAEESVIGTVEDDEGVLQIDWTVPASASLYEGYTSVKVIGTGTVNGTSTPMRLVSGNMMLKVQGTEEACASTDEDREELITAIINQLIELKPWESDDE